MAALVRPSWALVALAALASACSVYGADLVSGADPDGSGGDGGGGGSAGASAGKAAAGKAGDEPSGGKGGSAGSAGATGGGGTAGTPPMEAYLRGEVDPSPTTVVLSSEGKVDWVHWGLKGPNDRNSKAEVMPLLELTAHGTTSQVAYASGPIAFSWNDGAPTKAATTHNGIAFEGEGEGFELAIPAGAEERIVRVYLGVSGGTAQFSAQLSNDAMLTFEESLSSDDDMWTLSVVRLDYGLVQEPGATLNVAFYLETATAATGAISVCAISIDEQ